MLHVPQLGADRGAVTTGVLKDHPCHVEWCDVEGVEKEWSPLGGVDRFQSFLDLFGVFLITYF